VKHSRPPAATGIEGGADEELESFDGRERGKRGAGTQIGVFDDLVETLVNALDWLAFRPLSIDDFLKIARRFLERQHRITITRQALREPGIKKLVPAPKGDRTRSNHRDNLAIANATEKVIPKKIVQFSDHARPQQTQFPAVATSCAEEGGQPSSYSI
jgi:hypothetical protein